MRGSRIPKFDKESLLLRSDIGLLIYFILTNKIFLRILLIFTIGLLIRFGISSLWIVNFRDSFDLIANIYYFFVVFLVTFSEYLGLFARLPSIFELYNSICHSVRLFNFDQYIKAKIFTVRIKPYLNCHNNTTLGNSTLAEQLNPNSIGSTKNPTIK